MSAILKKIYEKPTLKTFGYIIEIGYNNFGNTYYTKEEQKIINKAYDNGETFVTIWCKENIGDETNPIYVDREHVIFFQTKIVRIHFDCYYRLYIC